MRGSVKPRALKDGRRVWDVRCDGPPRPDGRRRQLMYRGFPTRKAAEARLAEIVHTVDGGSFVKPTDVRLGDYLAEWLQSVRATVRPATWASYRRMVEAHVVSRIGGVRLRDLSGDTLNRLYAELLENGRRDGGGSLSHRTVRYAHAILHRALRDAVRWGKLTRNPVELADPPRDRPPEMRTWSAQQLRRFLEHVRGDRLYGAWLTAATTGLRRGEILGLRWQDVDLDGGRLAVRRTLIPVDDRLHFSEPKSDRGRRPVALDPSTVAGLRDHRKRQLEERLAWGPAYKDGDVVFCREDGSPIRPEGFTKAFRVLARAAGLPPIRLHDLRHTHATLALAAGIHPKVVSERLGHATVAFTLDRYSHAVPALEEDAATRVAGLIFGSADAIPRV